jgi:hypothetical protein
MRNSEREGWDPCGWIVIAKQLSSEMKIEKRSLKKNGVRFRAYKIPRA